MFRRFTLSLVLTVSAFAFGKSLFAATIIDNGTNTNYNLTSADSLVIATGTYTGNISAFPSGAKITVTFFATFQPASMPNNAAGKIYVFGTFTFTSSLTTNTNFTIYNFGIVTLGTVTIKGRDQVWTNHYGGMINFTGNVTMNGTPIDDDNNVLYNYETVNCSANFQMNSGSRLNNYKNFYVSGNTIVSGGTLNNIGKFETIGSISINSGTQAVNNYCRMISSGGIFISTGNMFNYSYLWARNDLGLGDITISSGSLVNIPVGGYVPIIHGRSLIHSGSATITGSGNLYFYGSTTKTGAGFTGTSGITTDTLKMNDITRVNTTIFYDAQTATVYPNAIYNVWGVPDSTRLYVIGCSLEINLEIPLAINWNYFFVNLANDLPLLTWSAEFAQGTVFEIQRSYDGRNFSTINVLPYEVSLSTYEYKDRVVDTHVPIVYYRIKSIELGGIEKFTQTRIVKFNNKPGSIYSAPNPFTNNFIINYRAAGRETITIRMFNVSGQQMLVKNVTVDEGDNNINITEAAQLAKGIYVIQVNKGHHMISSSKIIKQ
jgi:hypothetical protein